MNSIDAQTLCFHFFCFQQQWESTHTHTLKYRRGNASFYLRVRVFAELPLSTAVSSQNRFLNVVHTVAVAAAAMLNKRING